MGEGKWYGVLSRNTSHALWKGGMFHYVREKFGNRYIDTDGHFDDGGTVKPYEVSRIQHIHEPYYRFVSGHCPFCLSEMISGGPVSIEEPGAVQVVDCADCGRSWEDHYKLTTFVEVT